MNPKLALGIKITSIVFITGAIALEIFNLYLYLQDRSLPDNLIPIFWLGTVAIIAHAVEGVIAATKVNGSDRNPFVYGLYTFFVGFVGLQEISNKQNKI